MTIAEVITRIQDPMTAFILVSAMKPVIHQIWPDMDGVQEATLECHRAVYDTLLEFEAECVKRGYERARSELANGIVGQNGDDFIAATAAFLSR